MIKNTKESFLELARNFIKRDGIENLLSFLERTDFFTAPASTKYHDSYEGGLVYHSLTVFELLNQDLINSGDHNYDLETIAIVALFHDICKLGFYKVSTRNTKDEKGKWIQVPYYEVDDKFPVGHSEKSIIMLMDYIKLSAEEIIAINSHMGGFDDRKFIISKSFEDCPLAVYLHCADLKASYLYGKKG